MITVRLTCGLGNQMFQYALGKTLAARRRTSLALDVTWYRYDKLRKYSLGIFDVTEPIGEFSGRRLARALGQKLGIPGFSAELGRVRIPGFSYVVKERTFAFDPSILDAPDGVHLEGYWQSEKYFKEIEPAIRQKFTLSAGGDDIQRLAERIRSEQSVCVHVRRGDYVSNPWAATFMGVTGTEYYSEGMKLIHTRVENPTVFVFSDDTAWCTNHLRFDCPTTFVEHDGPVDRFREDLYLMTLCKHFIIANSTFSWWGAWLSNTKGTIVAPKQWFNSAKWVNGTDLDASDLIPAGWIRIQPISGLPKAAAGVKLCSDHC